MNVLVACEFSGVVREAFRRRGHEAFSCDLEPAEDGSRYHYQMDIRRVLEDPGRWDLLIAHPPCTYLCNSGVRWFTTIPKHPKPGVLYGEPRRQAMREAVKLFGLLWSNTIPRIAIENPIMHVHARTAFGFDYAQTIQPWQFGHGEVKRTCLWLRGLPPLEATNVVPGRVARVHRASPGPERWKDRSRTYLGVAEAMAEQWGGMA